MKRSMFCLLTVAALGAGWLPAAADVPQSGAPAEWQAVVEGGNDFAFDLYHRLETEPGNLFFSPYSISAALAMTYGGARGRTAEEMARTLHFPAQRQLDPAFHYLIDQMKSEGKQRSFELHIANALWGQRDHGFLPSFLDRTRASYGTGLREVDFRRSPDRARQTINGWVEEQTNQKIRNLLHPDDVDARTVLVLTNAIYFRAPWAEPFLEEDTKKEDFWLTAERKTPVDMMHRQERFGYLDAGSIQLLELPYRSRQQSMVVLLPKQKDGLAALEKALSAQQLSDWLEKMQGAHVAVALPRFTYSRRFRLSKTLMAMGMPLPFSREADLSGMDGRKGLHLHDVIHQGYVSTNEWGTEGAAATGVDIKHSRPSSVKQFRADHPFAFAIRDNQTRSILFLGRVVNPKP